MRRNDLPKVLILTLVKNAIDLAATYIANIERLTYPRDLLSVGILESDSVDGSDRAYRVVADALGMKLRRSSFHKRDFGYQLPEGLPRWEPGIQAERRAILAKSRNHLLFRALSDEDWVLWLDVDVIDFQADLIQVLLSYRKDILQPNCVLDKKGPSFDKNAWRDHGQRLLSDLRSEGEVVPLHAVGGTALLVKADLHRDGLIFPPYFYGDRNARARQQKEFIETSRFGEIETEGLGIMANDMGIRCYGLPAIEIFHRKK